MSPDDAADLIGDLSDDKAHELLELMDPEESKDVKQLLEYPEDTAGGIMTTEYAVAPEEFTAGQSLNMLRKIAQRCGKYLLYLCLVQIKRFSRSYIFKRTIIGGSYSKTLRIHAQRYNCS